MKTIISFKDVLIRTEILSGDPGFIIHMHGKLYKKEYNYGLHFESYVAKGIHEFCESLDSSRSRGWICEKEGRIVGFVALMDRGDQAQLRYFILDPSVRGIGLGKKLIGLFMDHLRSSGFKGAYLLTTNELPAAAHLYTSQGFILKEESPIHYPFDKDVIEQRYELTL